MWCHLSYDVKDSSETKNEDLLNRLTEKLVDLDSKIDIWRPVASTLIFKTTENWEDIVETLNNFKKEIYYVITRISEHEGKPYIKLCKDEELDKNYQIKVDTVTIQKYCP